MKSRTIAIPITLTTSTAFAAGPKAAPCLSAPDAVECLADVAIAALATERSSESRVDGMAGMRGLALAALRKSLSRIDGREVSCGDRATAIGTSIETLRPLESAS